MFTILNICKIEVHKLSYCNSHLIILMLNTYDSMISHFMDLVIMLSSTRLYIIYSSLIYNNLKPYCYTLYSFNNDHA